MKYNNLEEYTLASLERLERENEQLKEQVKNQETIIKMKEGQYASCRKEQLRLLEEKETLIAVLKDKINNNKTFISFEMISKSSNKDEANLIIEYFELEQGEEDE